MERKIFQKLYDRRWSGHRDCGSRGYRDLSGSICLRSGAGTGTGTDFRHCRWYLRILRGTFFAILFLRWFFAAVTSAIALLEVCASFAIDSLGWERKHAALVIGTAITLLGIPSALSFGVLSDVTILNQSVFDFAGLVTDNILMPLGGLTMCYYVGWKWKPEYLLAEIEADGTKFRLGKLWVFCIRFLTPIMVGIVSVTGFYNLYLAIR